MIKTIAAYAQTVTNTPPGHAAFVAVPLGVGIASVRQVDAWYAGSTMISPPPPGEQRR